MPKIPRDVSQERAIKALVRAGGVELQKRGKGSHRSVEMPNGFLAVLPVGTLKTGLLADMVKRSGITVQEFIDLL